MTVEIWTEAAQLLFCEYFFQIFGVGASQCEPEITEISPTLHRVGDTGEDSH
jgi:hypothetical protein